MAMSKIRRISGVGATLIALTSIASACASNSSPTTGTTSNAAPPTADTTGGVLPPGEPDTNHDGKVVIALLSPGNINDNGYYESFIAVGETFAKQHGWKVITRGSIPQSSALSAGRAACRQGADLIALGAAELKDALPAALEDVCKDTAWFMQSPGNVPVQPRVTLGSDIEAQPEFVGGYAAGLVMKRQGIDKAAFVAGPVADYSKKSAAAFRAGVHEVVADAKVSETFTGSNDDSAKGVEAMKAQLSQGIGLVNPYLGGATDAVAKLANENNLVVLTPGTDRCSSTSPKFDISIIFSPAYMLKAALTNFAAGTMKVGVAQVYKIGNGIFPDVRICNPVGDEEQKLDQFADRVGSGAIDMQAEIDRLGAS